MFASVSTPAPAAPPSVEAVLVRAAVSALSTIDPGELPGPSALADTKELLAAHAELEAVLVRRLGDVDGRQLHQLDASPTTTSWLRSRGAAVDAGKVTLARRLRRLGGVEEAVRRQSLSTADASRVAGALTRLRPLVDRPDRRIDGQDGEQVITAVVLDGVLDCVGEAMGGLADDDPRVLELHAQLSELSCSPISQLARLEAAFVLLAEHLPAGCLSSALARLVDALLPNELERRAARAADDAQLTLRPNSDGSGWLLRGELDLETGELLHTTLTASAATDPDNPSDTARKLQLREAGWQFGDPVPDDLTGLPLAAPRSCGRKLHDALKLALRTLLDSGDLGQRDKVAPHLAATVSVNALNSEPGALPARGASGVTLPLSLVKKWWCDSFVTRYVLGLGHRVIETSHTERTLKAHERRIKHLETGGQCEGAGCTRGPGCRLVPHHPDAFAKCGTTSLGDTALLCDHDHDAVHHGHTITLKNGRRLNADGWLD